MFLLLAAAATLITAGAHSYFGERRLIGPLVLSDYGPMQFPLGRRVLRFAWHLTSLLWVGQAALLVREAWRGGASDHALILGIGLFYTGVGLFDAAVTRGKHLGWPLLFAIGIFSLVSLL